MGGEQTGSSRELKEGADDPLELVPPVLPTLLRFLSLLFNKANRSANPCMFACKVPPWLVLLILVPLESFVLAAFDGDGTIVRGKAFVNVIGLKGLPILSK